MADKTSKVIERTYNIPLRREFQKVPRWKKTKKAVSAVRQFLQKHMKSDDVKLGKALNEKVWKNGWKNPPHHVKVTASKDDKGIVTAELFGVKKEEPPKTDKKKAEEKKEAKSSEVTPKEKEAKAEEKALQTDKPEPKAEKEPQKKDEKATQAVPSSKNQKF